jgi:hypothetical protein
MNAKKLDSSQQERGVVGAAPKEEAAEEVSVGGEMHDKPGAEHVIGGGMEFGGQKEG